MILAGVVLGRNAISLAKSVRNGADFVLAGRAHVPTQFGERLIASVEPNAFVMISYPRMATMFYYHQYVENRRPDLDLVVEPLLVSPWYLRGREGELGLTGRPVPQPHRRFAGFMDETHRSRVRDMLVTSASHRPTYRDSSFFEIRMSPSASFAFTAEAMAAVDRSRLLVDPWEPFKLFVRSIDERKLAETLLSSNTEPDLLLSDCGWLYVTRASGRIGHLPRHTSPYKGEDSGARDRPCPQNMVEEGPSLSDPGTVEVEAFYLYRRSIYHLGMGDSVRAYETLSALTRLNPLSPL